MKKIMLAAALLMIAGSKASAQYSSIVCTQQSISNSVPSEISGNVPKVFAAGQPFITSTTSAISAKSWAIKVTNLDPNADLCCSSSAAVTCASGTNHGDPVTHGIAPPNWMAWMINQAQGFYCVSNSITGPTNAEVCTVTGGGQQSQIPFAGETVGAGTTTYPQPNGTQALPTQDQAARVLQENNLLIQQDIDTNVEIGNELYTSQRMGVEIR